MFTVFISHSSNDAPLIEVLRPAAEAAGVTMYLAEHDRTPGLSLANKVRQAITDCAVVVVLLTPNSYNSAYVHQEVGFACSLGKLVIPIKERSVSRDVLAMLEGLEYVDLDLDRPQDCARAVAAVLTDEVARRTQEQFDAEARARTRQADAQAPATADLFAVAAVLALVVFALSRPELGLRPGA